MAPEEEHSLRRFENVGSVGCLVGAVEGNMVSDLSPTLVRRTGMKLNRFSRTEHHRRYPPWAQPSIYPDDRVTPPEEDDIDREAHKEHVHPHERSESAVLEQHTGAGLESVATQQAAPLTGQTTGVLEPRAQHGPPGLI